LGKEIYLVKRRGNVEPFDDKKLYASIYSACMSAHLHEQKCEGIADKVLKAVKTKMPKKEKSIYSTNIKNMAHEELKKHSKDAAFLYDTHLDLS